MSAREQSYRVLIPDGQFGHALSVVRCLGHEPGVTVIVAGSKPDLLIRHSRYTKSFHVLPAGDEESWVAGVHKLAGETRVDVILPVSELGILRLSRNRELHGCQYTIANIPDSDTFYRATDKRLLATVISSAGLRRPATWIPGTISGNSPLPVELSFPVVIKATRSSFGREMYIAQSADELRRLLAQVEGNGSEYIVQRFVDGYDIDCSVLCRDGEILAYTIQRERIPAPINSFKPPQVVEFARDEDVFTTVTSLMRALQWNGVAHVDMRFDESDGHAKTLEINARYWGSLLGSLSVGVNFPHLACLDALGVTFSVPPYKNELFFGLGISGRVKSAPEVPYSWKRSNLPYVLRDPLPEILARYLRF